MLIYIFMGGVTHYSWAISKMHALEMQPPVMTYSVQWRQADTHLTVVPATNTNTGVFLGGVAL